MYKLLKTNSLAEKLKLSILNYTLLVANWTSALRKHYKFTT